MRRQFLSFAAVGAAGFFVDAGVLYAAMSLLAMDRFSARLLSFLAAASFTWYVNRRLTFAAADRSRPLVQWARFLAVNSIGGVVNYAVYVVVVFALGAALWVPLLGVALGSVAGLLLNFLGSRRLVFAVRGH